MSNNVLPLPTTQSVLYAIIDNLATFTVSPPTPHTLQQVEPRELQAVIQPIAME